MTFQEFISGPRTPSDPWSGESKIPWNDPDFSRRMLREHISQEHDWASRRTERIERQVAWIHAHVPENGTNRILDLGCGPGMYLHRLAALGHDCTGLDFSPASIEYARRMTGKGLPCVFIEGDVRTVDFGTGYDLAMMLFGEFNTFSPEESVLILEKARKSLRPGGCLLLEAHTFEAVQRIGTAERTWFTAEAGLFSDSPHLCLTESAWLESHHTAVREHYVFTRADEIERYCSTTVAWTVEEYHRMMEQAGFSSSAIEPYWEDEPESDFLLLKALR